jgi:hypothetical protein
LADAQKQLDRASNDVDKVLAGAAVEVFQAMEKVAA